MAPIAGDDGGTSSRPAVIVRGLRLSYRGAAEPIIDRLDLSVARGETVALVGASGTGKTTLLRHLAGFQGAEAGEVEIGGRSLHGPDPRTLLIFQGGGLFPWLTSRENVGYGLRDRPRSERAAVIAEMLELVGLTAYAAFYPHQLSGGMCQRIELARALAAGAEVLLLDEPFSALDSLTRMKLGADLERIQQASKITVILSTHDVDEAVRLADRVLILDGRPARIREEVRVDLPRPRDDASTGFFEARVRLFASLGVGKSVLAPRRALVAGCISSCSDDDSIRPTPTKKPEVPR